MKKVEFGGLIKTSVLNCFVLQNQEVFDLVVRKIGFDYKIQNKWLLKYPKLLNHSNRPLV
jgi:hypothetical protein